MWNGSKHSCQSGNTMSTQARFEKYAMIESLFTTSGIVFIDIKLKLKKHKNDFNW